MLFAELFEVADLDPHDGPLNMAIDEILLRSASIPHLRIYRWERRTISFGYFGRFAEVSHRWPGMSLVRRWSGGGEVEHGNDLTYTLAVPRTSPFFALNSPASYRAIHECLAELIAESGASVHLAATAAKSSSACFESASPHDVIAGETKVAGAAQRRTRDGLLHQGSIQGVSSERFRERIKFGFASRTVTRRISAAELAAAAELSARKYATESWLKRF